MSSSVEPMEDEGLDSDAEADIGDSDGEEESDADEDLVMEMEDSRPKADEMGVEHLATLERLRQNQRQDYLKVKKEKKTKRNSVDRCVLIFSHRVPFRGRYKRLIVL